MPEFGFDEDDGAVIYQNLMFTVVLNSPIELDEDDLAQAIRCGLEDALGSDHEDIDIEVLNNN